MVKQAHCTHKTTKKFVKLTTLDRNGLEYIMEPVVIAKGAADHVKLNQ
jgi:hypothetical protein